MLGSLILCRKGMRIIMFQLSGFFSWCLNDYQKYSLGSFSYLQCGISPNSLLIMKAPRLVERALAVASSEGALDPAGAGRCGGGRQRA